MWYLVMSAWSAVNWEFLKTLSNYSFKSSQVINLDNTLYCSHFWGESWCNHLRILLFWWVIAERIESLVKSRTEQRKRLWWWKITKRKQWGLSLWIRYRKEGNKGNSMWGIFISDIICNFAIQDINSGDLLVCVKGMKQSLKLRDLYKSKPEW